MGANIEEITAFLAGQFPNNKLVIEAVGNKAARVKHLIGSEELRPGGTVAGPVLMGLADAALYIAIFGEVGIVPLAVTTSLTINFMRKPTADAAVMADCKLMKVGRILVVGEVTLCSEDQEEPVAHVVGTYSIPPIG